MNEIEEVARLSQWYKDGNTSALVGYVLGRYSVDVSEDEIYLWFGMNESEFPPCNIREWLKNRLIDRGHLPHLSLGCPEVRLFCYLHFDSVLESIGSDDRNFMRTQLSRGIQRSAFHRLRSRRPIGITAAARKLVKESLQVCPYCNTRFRNPDALVLHIEDRHAVDIVRSLSNS